jgi:serine/threonine-protein kinase
MGRVMEARHCVTGRLVALKQLNPGFSVDAAAVERLLQEAMACGRVQHPNVVDVYDAGEADGVAYVAMEKLQGESLAKRLERGPLPPSLALELTRQTLAGLEAAHAAGIVHRDLKPDNLFLAGPQDSPTVKILDFGISKLSSDHRPDTQTGAILGTPAYMSPEQIYAPSTVDVRADIYSLGVVLFEMLTGRRPFEADSYPALLVSILNDPFPALDEHLPDADAALQALVSAAVQRDRAHRIPDAVSFSKRLAGYAAAN